MNTFQFKEPQLIDRPELLNAYSNYDNALKERDRLDKLIQKSLVFQDISGSPLPDQVVKHFQNIPRYDFSTDVTKLSDYQKSFPDNNLEEKDLASYLERGLAVEVKDFFGDKETYILTSGLEEYYKPYKSKTLQTFDEFAKPFIAHDPSIDEIPTISGACSKIMANYIDSQPNFLKSDNLKTARMYLKDDYIKEFVSDMSGRYIAYDLGLNAYDLGLSNEGKADRKTSTPADKMNMSIVKQNELLDYVNLLEKCKEGGASPETAVKVVNSMIKEAENQRKNFELKYNELRPEFDKSQPFKNQAFDIVDKLSDKFNQAVQGLKKVWQVVTTKNLAIEQSKDKQQTVQPQKNTPEVKQQSKAKDMER